MTQPRTNAKQLAEVLDGLEDLILAAPDEEFVASPRSLNDTTEVRAMIALQLARQKLKAIPAGSSRPPARSPGTSPARQAAKDIAFLQKLVASRPDLTRQLSAVFNSSGTPDASQVDKIVDELVQLGRQRPKAPRR